MPIGPKKRVRPMCLKQNDLAGSERQWEAGSTPCSGFNPYEARSYCRIFNMGCLDVTSFEKALLRY